MREDPTAQFQIIGEEAMKIKKKTKIHSRNLVIHLRRMHYFEFGKIYQSRN